MARLTKLKSSNLEIARLKPQSSLTWAEFIQDPWLGEVCPMIAHWARQPLKHMVGLLAAHRNGSNVSGNVGLCSNLYLKLLRFMRVAVWSL